MCRALFNLACWMIGGGVLFPSVTVVFGDSLLSIGTTLETPYPIPHEPITINVTIHGNAPVDKFVFKAPDVKIPDGLSLIDTTQHTRVTDAGFDVIYKMLFRFDGEITPEDEVLLDPIRVPYIEDGIEGELVTRRILFHIYPSRMVVLSLPILAVIGALAFVFIAAIVGLGITWRRCRTARMVSANSHQRDAPKGGATVDISTLKRYIIDSQYDQLFQVALPMIQSIDAVYYDRLCAIYETTRYGGATPDSEECERMVSFIEKNFSRDDF